MIRINLLPAELQQAARTPVKLFFTIIGGVVAVLLTAFLYSYLWFDVMVLNERVERKQEEVAHLKTNAAEVDSILEDIQDYKRREQAIIGIKTNRILWSRKLDRLTQITPDHIWILQLHMKEMTPEEIEEDRQAEELKGTGGYLELVCISSGKEVKKITDFRKRLKNADAFFMNFVDEPIRMETFYSDFINITRPEWQLVMLNNFADPYNLKFTVRLALRELSIAEDAS